MLEKELEFQEEHRLAYPSVHGGGELSLFISRLTCSLDPLRLGAVVLLGETPSSSGTLTEVRYTALATMLRPHHFHGIRPHNIVWCARKLRRRPYSDIYDRTYLHIRLQWSREGQRYLAAGFSDSDWVKAVVEPQPDPIQGWFT